MFSFTRSLIEEHLIIAESLDLLTLLGRRAAAGETAQLEEFESSLRIMRFLATRHHEKEENLLFPTLEAENCPRQGGPKCTYFMGHRMEWNPVERIEAEHREAALSSPFEPRNPHLAGLLERNSMLSIPIEEHQAGHLALEMIALEIEPLRNGGTADGRRLGTLIRKYGDLLRMHIRKENECLFHLCDRHIPESRQNELLAESRRLDHEAADQIRSVMSDLRMLSR